MDPKVVEALVAENARAEDSPLNELTPRERDVLREMAEGEEQRRDRRGALPHPALGREGDPFDLPEARADLGDGRAQAGEGRDSSTSPRAARAGATPETRRPPVAALAISETAAERFDAIAQPLQPGLRSGGGGQLEDEPPVVLTHPDRRLLAVRGPESLDPAQVDGPRGLVRPARPSSTSTVADAPVLAAAARSATATPPSSSDAWIR